MLTKTLDWSIQGLEFQHQILPDEYTRVEYIRTRVSTSYPSHEDIRMEYIISKISMLYHSR